MRWALLLILLGAGPLPALAAPDMPGHAALATAAPCQGCHAQEAGTRWASSRWRACTPYCQTCHTAADMKQHHPVGTLLTKLPAAMLPLTTTRHTACFSCHDLSRPRFDQVRWKAESLYGRWFRTQTEYKTYFLAIRNDRGQLCLACH